MRGRPTSTGLRVAAVASIVTLLLVGGGVSHLDLPGHAEMFGTDLFSFLIPLLLASVMSLVVARRTVGVERRFWALLGVVVAVVLVAEAYLSYYVAWIDLMGPRLPAPFQLLHLVAGGLFIALLVTMSSFADAPLSTRIRFYVDVAAGALVAWPVVYSIETRPALEKLPEVPFAAGATLAFYPVFGLVMLLGTFACVVGWRAARWRVWEWLVAASLSMYAIGMLVHTAGYAAMQTQVVAGDAAWFSMVFGVAAGLLFIAAVVRVTTPGEQSTDRLGRAERRVPLAGPAYPLLLAVSLPGLVLATLQLGERREGAITLASALAVTLLLVVRSWLTSLERAHHLTGSLVDPVSGALNHRALHERLARELSRVSGGGRLHVAAFDIDRFREVNNAFGHATGDRLLREVASGLAGSARSEESVYRLSSDEFVAVLPGYDAEGALAWARQARRRAEDRLVVAGRQVRISVGIAGGDELDTRAEDLLDRAVAAQSMAKAGEGEPVVLFDAESVRLDPAERLEAARRRSHRATVRALAATVDARDTDTRHHSENVRRLAEALAAYLGLSAVESANLGAAAVMHDVGKIGVRDDVLRKPAALTLEERRHVEEHPDLAARILSPARLDEIIPGVRHHHERWDGRGYPDRLAGEEIPYHARLLAVCDAFEAMTANRAYRAALEVEEALCEVERSAGTQFDPAVAAAFVAMVRSRAYVPAPATDA